MFPYEFSTGTSSVLALLRQLALTHFSHLNRLNEAAYFVYCTLTIFQAYSHNSNRRKQLDEFTRLVTNQWRSIRFFTVEYRRSRSSKKWRLEILCKQSSQMNNLLLREQTILQENLYADQYQKRYTLKLC